jgi:uncharacterized protein with HEPN domain
LTRDPLDYLEHIDESIRFIEEWTAAGHDDFIADVRTQAAVVRRLHELAESTMRLEAMFAGRYPDVPWRDVRAFRNVVVHDYLGLNLDRIWNVVEEHLPRLKPHIAKMLADLA